MATGIDTSRLAPAAALESIAISGRPAARGSSLDSVSTIELTEEAMSLAQQEAARRGVSVAEVIDEAVRRSIAGEDLRRLLEAFSAQDASDPDALHDAAAQLIAGEELAAVRRGPRTEN